jgi:hypothetical protein
MHVVWKCYLDFDWRMMSMDVGQLIEKLAQNMEKG